MVDGRYEVANLLSGLRKNELYGIHNTVFECDLAEGACEWGTKFTVGDMCQLIELQKLACGDWLEMPGIAEQTSKAHHPKPP